MPRAKKMLRDPVDELVDALARPIYVLRMAAAVAVWDLDKSRRAGAEKRVQSAREDIREVVERWVDEHGGVSSW